MWSENINMTKTPDIGIQYFFTGLPINELITLPLIAAAEAQARMAEVQVQSLLRNCFTLNSDGVYEPILLKMSITRGVLEPGSHPDPRADLIQVTTDFYLPLITIFPFSSLGVEVVNIDFELDVTAQYSTQINPSQADNSNQSNNRNTSNKNRIKLADKDVSSIQMLGQIAPKNKVVSKTDSSEVTVESTRQNAAFSFNITAGPLPLTKGLLSIIDLYTNAITPIDMPEQN